MIFDRMRKLAVVTDRTHDAYHLDLMPWNGIWKTMPFSRGQLMISPWLSLSKLYSIGHLLDADLDEILPRVGNGLGCLVDLQLHY